MNQNQQAELLIRVDQNVINLVKIVEKHLEDDKDFQTIMWQQLKPLNETNAERRGAVKFANLMYGIVGGFVTLVGSFLFPHGS